MDGYGSSEPILTKQDGQEEGQQGNEWELSQVLQQAQGQKQMEQSQEEDPNPVWDGSEAEFVPDEDAQIYEQQNPGIGLNYVLRQEEAYTCLKRGRYTKTTGVRAGVEAGVTGLMAVLFGVSYFLYGNTVNLVMAALCLVLCAVVVLVPHLGMKSRARQIANGRELHVEVYPDTVMIGRGDGQWEIPLDGTSCLEEFEEMLLLTTPKNKMLAIPLRSIEPAVLPDVQAMLVAGTQPSEEEE